MEEPKHFIINRHLEILDYPVGVYINENLKFIEMMAIEFNNIIAFRDKDVNIICRGSSGAIIAAVLITKISNKARIIHVKKPNEDSHSSITPLWTGDNVINIIVDDQISSGRTMNAIWEVMSNRYSGLKIDCLIIGGHSNWDKLNFTPEYLICQRK